MPGTHTLPAVRKDGTLLPKCVSLIGSAAALQLLGFVLRIVILRFGGRQTMAVWQLTSNAYSILMAAALQGVILAVSRQSAALLAAGKREAVFRLLRSGIGLFLTLFAAVSLPFWAGPSFAAAHLLGDRRTEPALKLLLLCILLTGIENLHKAVFLGAQNVRPAGISETAELAIRILAVRVLLPLSPGKDPETGAALVVAAMIISECFSVIFLRICFRKFFGRKPAESGPPAQAELKRDLRRTALPVCGSALLNKLLFALTNLLIPALLMLRGAGREEALSDYAVLFSMALPLTSLPSCMIIPVGKLILPRISASLAKNDRADCLRKSAKLFQLTALAALPCLLFVSFYAGPVCSLLYHSRAAAPYLPLLALSSLAEYFEIGSADLLNGLGKTFPAAASIVAEGAVLLGFTILLVPRLGLNGFCIGRLISILTAVLINFTALFRSLPLKFRPVNWMGRPLAAALTALPVSFAAGLLPIPPAAETVLCGIVYFTGYGLILPLYGTKWWDYFRLHF